jgi:hypothetical protein
MATLSEFPDRQLLGKDVIWCGDDQLGFFRRIASYRRQPTEAAPRRSIFTA